jgi:hypothetical protein
MKFFEAQHFFLSKLDLNKVSKWRGQVNVNGQASWIRKIHPIDWSKKNTPYG